MAESEMLLQVRNLKAGYDNRQVLFDVSIEVMRGDIALLVGGNGCGKSTLLKAVYGLLNGFAGWTGTVTFAGEDITTLEPFLRIGRGLVYVPQQNNIFEHMTVTENLEVVSSHMTDKRDAKRRLRQLFDKLPELAAMRNRVAIKMSGGERQQLALAMALIQNPIMVLLDEPTAGLAPGSIKKYWPTIISLNKEGMTFLIVEHNIQDVVDSCGSIISMELGRIQETWRRRL